MKHSDLFVGMQVEVTTVDPWVDTEAYPNNPPVGTVLTVTSIDDDGSIDFRVEWDGDEDYLMNTLEVEPFNG